MRLTGQVSHRLNAVMATGLAFASKTQFFVMRFQGDTSCPRCRDGKEH